MYKECRDFLKDSIRKQINFSKSAQSRGLAQPPWQKSCPSRAKKIELVTPGKWKTIPSINLETAIARRKSRRGYTNQELSLEELSFLLWATQGLRPAAAAKHNFRTVPSAGCRQAVETYVAALQITGLEKAIYRYLPLDHALVETVRYPDLEEQLTRATFGQTFCGSGAATFI